MVPTRKLWGVAGFVLLLTALAVVFDRPLLLVGSVGVGAWILARQYQFLQVVTALERTATIDQHVSTSTVTTGSTTPVTLRVDLGNRSPVTVEVTPGLPIAASTTARSISLTPGMGEAELTDSVSWPVAGRHEFQPADVVVTDGLFRSTFTAGSTPTVTVEPPAPTGTHVGRGGIAISNPFGSHSAGRGKSGIVPAEIREYVPGDSATDIDWKATARLSKPHVREYEAETDRVTYLVFDQPQSLTLGQPGMRQFEYLREVALGLTSSARRLSDPLGLCLVNQDGTEVLRAEASHSHYDVIKRRLLELEPDTESVSNTARKQSVAIAGQDPQPFTEPPAARTTRRSERGTNAASQRVLYDEDADSFTTTLRPYLESASDRLASSTLSESVARVLTAHDGNALTVLYTDDSDRRELETAVRIAREQGSSVLVFLTPAVLFEPGGLADLDVAYERYVGFEQYRQRLDAFDGVSALEVAPEDRLATVLERASYRSQRRST